MTKQEPRLIVDAIASCESTSTRTWGFQGDLVRTRATLTDYPASDAPTRVSLQIVAQKPAGIALGKKYRVTITEEQENQK